jgi:hypothetical protein
MESRTGRMVRKRQQKGEGNGESHEEKVREKEWKGEGNGKVNGENGKGRRAVRGRKWGGAQGEW